MSRNRRAGLEDIRSGTKLNNREMIALTSRLSFPPMVTEISILLMAFIDAAMVGSLGADSSAAVGLVSSTTWLIGGLMRAASAGFTVQVATMSGAQEWKKARIIMKHGVLIVTIFGIILGIIGFAIAGGLPIWLGGGKEVIGDASIYFKIYALSLPFLALDFVASGMLQCSGDMKTPSILNVFMCLLDVIFNYFFIYETRPVSFLGLDITMPGLGMGVAGASLGTSLSEVVCGLLMFYFLWFRSDKLHYQKGEREPIRREEIRRASKISFPITFENILSGGAQIVATRIVSPLGAVALAANSFAVTTEGFCYMPGFGIQSASTTLVGQSLGAGRRDVSKKIGWICVISGMVIMTITGGLMYAFAPVLIGFLTPVPAIRELGAEVLRIEAFAEPFFAAQIVGSGVFRGAQDTLGPSIINFSTMWIIRLPLAYFLASRIGLRGVWIAMCLQLIICGIIFLIRLWWKSRKQQN